MSTRTHVRKPGLARKVVFGLAGGLLLIAGVVLLVLPGPGLLLVLADLILPLGGWATGMSLILSGLILLGLLVVSYRHEARRRGTPAP